MSSVAILIPAYHPSSDLLELVSELREKSDDTIVVVDDGSGNEYASVFASLRSVRGVVVIGNAVNLGKGAALKLGMNWLLVAYPDLAGAITADADGQHSVTDILRVRDRFMQDAQSFVLGARAFDSNVPLRSRVGNGISRVLYRLLLGLKLADTQTGLRAIPRALAERCLSIRSNRYEFETEQLALVASLGLRTHEVPIQTIYKHGNTSSHFDPFFDSVRIYFVVLRYAASSILTSIADLAVFSILTGFGVAVMPANLASRAVALFVQFGLLTGFVFHTRGGALRFIAFVAYVMFTGFVSAILQLELTSVLGLNAVVSKIAVELIIFVFNFLVLRDLLFTRRPE